LLCEEVNTEVAVLASGSGGGDFNDLARSTLKNQEIANTDVVAGNGDSVRRRVDFDRGMGMGVGGAMSRTRS
jgi:hypothetical protein